MEERNTMNDVNHYSIKLRKYGSANILLANSYDKLALIVSFQQLVDQVIVAGLLLVLIYYTDKLYQDHISCLTN